MERQGQKGLLGKGGGETEWEHLRMEWDSVRMRLTVVRRMQDQVKA